MSKRVIVAQAEDANQSQLQRLKHIDFCLLFLGKISRKSHMEHFAISSAAATRDLALYKDKYPENIFYDSASKEYRPLNSFQTIFKHGSLDALRFLSKKIEIDSYSKSLIPSENPTYIRNPDIKILSEITAAIYQKKALKVEYGSLSSGITKRELVPLAMVDNGLRWHVRGYDRKNGRFGDFVINRIKKASILSESQTEETERLEADIQWNRIVEMEIVPHPDLPHKEVIEHEYGMKEGILRINCRAAVAGYFLRLWNIDCSQGHSGEPEEHHLWLKNNPALYGISNIELAPNYSSSYN